VFDLVLRKAEVKSGEGKFNATAQVHPVPEFARAIGPLQHNHGVLSGLVVTHDLLLFDLTKLGAVRAVENVGLGHFVMPLAHQLLLDAILKIFDAHELLTAAGNPLGQSSGDLLRRRRVHSQ